MVANRQTYQNSISIRDSRGFVSVFRWWQTVDIAAGTAFTDYAAVFEAVLAAVLGLTNGVPVKASGFPGFDGYDPGLYGGTGQYTAVYTKANMMFLDTGGKRHLYHIPAPKVAIFDTDLTTVLNDGSQALVEAFKTAMLSASGTSYVSSRNTAGLTTDSPGLGLGHFLGGKLVLGKQPKRFNEFIKSSHLVTGEGE